ncbi:MAG: glyoxalase [Hyphococcus sp.]|nr:MAG: glyoxalase [Marinicaulis sp.]
MPKLEHANLVLTDIEPTLEFLKLAFPQWRIRGEGKSEWYGKPRRWVHFGDDDTYITLNDHGEGKQRDLKGYSPGLAHLGFSVEGVEAIAARLTEAGYIVTHNGEDHPHRKNIYYREPDGLEIEFVEYFSDAPEERNLYV